MLIKILCLLFVNKILCKNFGCILDADNPVMKNCLDKLFTSLKQERSLDNVTISLHSGMNFYLENSYDFSSFMISDFYIELFRDENQPSEITNIYIDIFQNIQLTLENFSIGKNINLYFIIYVLEHLIATLPIVHGIGIDPINHSINVHQLFHTSELLIIKNRKHLLTIAVIQIIFMTSL